MRRVFRWRFAAFRHKSRGVATHVGRRNLCWHKAFWITRASPVRTSVATTNHKSIYDNDFRIATPLWGQHFSRDSPAQDGHGHVQFVAEGFGVALPVELRPTPRRPAPSKTAPAANLGFPSAAKSLHSGAAAGACALRPSPERVRTSRPFAREEADRQPLHIGLGAGWHQTPVAGRELR